MQLRLKIFFAEEYTTTKWNIFQVMKCYQDDPRLLELAVKEQFGDERMPGEAVEKRRRGPRKNIRMGIAQPSTFALAQGMVPTTLSGSGRGRDMILSF